MRAIRPFFYIYKIDLLFFERDPDQTLKVRVTEEASKATKLDLQPSVS